MTIFLLDIKEIWILSIPFIYKPADMYWQSGRYDEANSRFSPNYVRTQTICTLPATLSLTFHFQALQQIKHSDTFCHLSISILLLLNFKYLDNTDAASWCSVITVDSVIN